MDDRRTTGMQVTEVNNNKMSNEYEIRKRRTLVNITACKLILGTNMVKITSTRREFVCTNASNFAMEVFLHFVLFALKIALENQMTCTL